MRDDIKRTSDDLMIKMRELSDTLATVRLRRELLRELEVEEGLQRKQVLR